MPVEYGTTTVRKRHTATERARYIYHPIWELINNMETNLSLFETLLTSTKRKKEKKQKP